MRSLDVYEQLNSCGLEFCEPVKKMFPHACGIVEVIRVCDGSAKMFCEDYARGRGFGTRVGHFNRSKPAGRATSREFLCSGDGLKKRPGERCKAMLKIELKSENKWVVTKFGKEHTHPVLSHSEVHHLNPRHFTARRNSVVESRQGVDIVPSGVMYVSMDGNHVPAEMNHVGKNARSRAAYSHFGDAAIMDTLYRRNQHTVPFAPFTGVNHHGQKIMFGCALLLDESKATFVWLFQTFLAAMNDRPPVSLTTDKDRAIQVAVSKVFPEARHCIIKWHMLKEGQERMTHVCLAHPNFRQWVLAYFRDSFFAIFPCLGFDSSFFDGYVNQQTTLPLFFREYERALENSFEREIDPDFDTICTTPVLRTPSPMEKQAANLYTKRIFSKFQEELVETLVYTANRIDGDAANSIYRVAKFEDDNKAYNIVSPNNAEMKANCSCQMFEYSGILCRHVLTVFTEAMKLAEEGAIASETYGVVLASLREGGKKVAGIKRSIAKVPASISQVSGVGYDDIRTSTATPEMTPLLWPWQDEILRRFNLNDAHVTSHPISDSNAPIIAPVSVNHDDGHSDRTLQDYSRTPLGESEVKFSLSRLTLEPMLRSMAYISEQLSTPANKVAVINLKLQDSETTSGESEVKFQVSRDTLGAMLRSMAYIREQLSNAIDTKQDNTAEAAKVEPTFFPFSYQGEGHIGVDLLTKTFSNESASLQVLHASLNWL
ncbi:UNVERIFIED_CONTAM: protein FAR1-RELATED SEQUENCE 3 [Sesamum radiatum]|uniref:Protein FAR1-RELATED SEQUENCE n=1 Tax=Sesamum radiatum TaxID=300843 RepID=A0AAW2UQ08_SESRA